MKTWGPSDLPDVAWQDGHSSMSAPACCLGHRQGGSLGLVQDGTQGQGPLPRALPARSLSTVTHSCGRTSRPGSPLSTASEHRAPAFERLSPSLHAVCWEEFPGLRERASRPVGCQGSPLLLSDCSPARPVWSGQVGRPWGCEPRPRQGKPSRGVGGSVTWM